MGRCTGAVAWGYAGAQRGAAQGCSVRLRRGAAWGRAGARRGAAHGRGMGLQGRSSVGLRSGGAARG